MVAQDASSGSLIEQDVLSATTNERLEEENRKKTLAFKVSHILVSLLLLWLL
jgi:hypothetical protein